MKSKSPAKSPVAEPTTATAKSAVARKPRARKNTSVAVTSSAARDAAATAPQDLIAQRAYELFIEQGGEHGRDIEHWLAAERELLTRA